MATKGLEVNLHQIFHNTHSTDTIYGTLRVGTGKTANTKCSLSRFHSVSLLRKCRPIIHIEKCWIQIPKRQHAVEDSDESATVRGSSIGHTTEIEDERTSQVATWPDTCRGKSTLDQRKLHKGSQSEEKRRSEDSRKNPGTNNTPAVRMHRPKKIHRPRTARVESRVERTRSDPKA
ncbi:uncharacterized protein LOC109422554 [Aedes albopictus]|uniref:Uncharacterized protein n=1 Tax=Aedes albopictus TaxID=7160 RepID=A0ABM1YYW5_AEDAL